MGPSAGGPRPEFTVPFHGGRRVRVYVPSRVRAPAPVLVLFDGQNIFDDASSYAGGWHADEVVEKLPGTVTRPIVVGLDNGGSARIHELWLGLDPLLRCIMHEVLPELAARCPVQPGCMIGGSSMGGLAALLALARHPEVFRGAMCMSPSIWMAQPSVYAEIRLRALPPAAPIYMDVGGRESAAMQLHAGRMAELLTARGANLSWRVDKRGGHHERHWRRRLPRALKWLFGRRPRTAVSG